MKERNKSSMTVRDSIGIEALLWWVYQDQAADAVSRAAGAGVWPSSGGNNFSAVERYGVPIDCPTAVYSPPLHPDAEEVHAAVRRLKGAMIGLVIMHAKAGTRPDWMPGAVPTPEAILRANGKPIMEYWDREKKRPAYCLIRYVPEKSHIDFMRAQWVSWWDALDSLAVALRERLSRDVLPLKMPRNPWAVDARVDAQEGRLTHTQPR